MKHRIFKIKKRWSVLLILGAAAVLCLTALGTGAVVFPQNSYPLSDHYDGQVFFNPWTSPDQGDPPVPVERRGTLWYLWRWAFGPERPEWPEVADQPSTPPPPTRVEEGAIRITVVGHATFLIQMDGVNILTDPIWSKRCSPVSWAGPKRHQPPGLAWADLPPIDLVLISHDHYDHLDIPTLKKLADRGTPRAVVPLGNRERILETGIPRVEELDWWDTVTVNPKISITLVPARHFSGRTPWDRDRTLWAGFVICGASGKVYFAGDTAYGPHIREIGERFAPITVALLPISPFRSKKPNDPTPPRFSLVHMGPQEAVQAHRDLMAQRSIASHFRVFRLGWEGFDDAVRELSKAQHAQGVDPSLFTAPVPGQVVEVLPTDSQAWKGERPIRAAAGG